MQQSRTAEEILALPDFQSRVVSVPEWGCEVEVTSYSKKVERKIRDNALVRNGDGGERVDVDIMEKWMFVYGVTNPRFTPEQFDRLLDKDCVPINRILKAVYAVTGFSSAAEVTAMEKTFPAGSTEGV